MSYILYYTEYEYKRVMSNSKENIKYLLVDRDTWMVTIEIPNVCIGEYRRVTGMTYVHPLYLECTVLYSQKLSKEDIENLKWYHGLPERYENENQIKELILSRLKKDIGYRRTARKLRGLAP